MARYNHAYDFAFELVSEDEEANDVTPAMLRVALLKRISNLSDRELNEACDRFDTFKDET